MTLLYNIEVLTIRYALAFKMWNELLNSACLCLIVQGKAELRFSNIGFLGRSTNA